MPFIPHTAEDVASMLETLGVSSIETLFAAIPESMAPQSFDLAAGLSEQETCVKLEAMANRNILLKASFLGGGFYDHFIPAAVDFLAGRGEFYTAYTPYQPEASQGTLQAIFEYQTALCRLFELDAANASVYDGGSAIFEAVMMAVRSTKREHFIVDSALNPLYQEMLQTLTLNLGLQFTFIPHKNGVTDIAAITSALRDDTAAIVVQNPNFFGTIADFTELCTATHNKGALVILCCYPVMQSVLKTPGEMGVDIAVADGQSLGLSLSFGGPYLGMMACNKSLVRQMPGRIVGRTEDKIGREGYVLTLQAREQHIRRAKATSNICSNQALCALKALIHMCLLGPEGLTRTAELAMIRARETHEALCSLPGITPLNDAPFGNEFAVILPLPAQQVLEALLEKDVAPGIPAATFYPEMENVLLVATTEKNTPEQITLLTKLIGELL